MIHVIVTQEDIEKAFKDRLNFEWPRHCPVALALQRLGYDAAAWPRKVILYQQSGCEKLEKCVPTPEVARTFMDEIDNAEYDESLPGELEFELNDPFE